jgi:hypothetical protein
LLEYEKLFVLFLDLPDIQGVKVRLHKDEDLVRILLCDESVKSRSDVNDVTSKAYVKFELLSKEGNIKCIRLYSEINSPDNFVDIVIL